VIISTSNPLRARSSSMRSRGSEKAGCLAVLLLLASAVPVVAVEIPGRVKGEIQLEMGTTERELS